MPYLNLDPNYFDHPKTRRLVGLLGPMADVLPIRLWAYCARLHRSDGAMRGYSDVEIEGVIHWTGTAKEAIRAMTEVGFLLCTKRGYKCVDWLQHQGHLEMFSRRARECANKRWGRRATSNATSNARSDATQCSIKQSSKQPIKQALPSKEASGLAEKLRGLIIGNNPRARTPDNLTAWARSADLMLSADKRTAQEIDSVMTFSQKDPFWKQNILSMPKLREKFDQLWMKMQGGFNGNGNKTSGASHIVGTAAPTPGKYSGIVNH